LLYIKVSRLEKASVADNPSFLLSASKTCSSSGL
jgi:hypothetical protein